jgi:hypothetical protein
VSLKRLDASDGAELELRIGDQMLLPLRVDGAWHELRFAIAKGAVAAGNVRAELRAVTDGVRVQVDHVLLVPRTASGDVAARGG